MARHLLLRLLPIALSCALWRSRRWARSLRRVADTAIATQRVVLVLADISGYTRFARLHRLSQAHAESIICELLDAVIMNTEQPLKLNELLGDAAFFYAPSDGTAATARGVFDQITQFCEAFDKRALGVVPREVPNG